jgi:hypothetical protein
LAMPMSLVAIPLTLPSSWNRTSEAAKPENKNLFLLCPFVTVCWSFCIYPFVCLSLCLYLFVCLSLSFCLSLFVSVCSSLSICLCLFVSVCLSLPVCLCLFVSVYWSPSVNLRLFVSVSLSIFLFFPVSKILHYFSVSVSYPINPSVSSLPG